MNNYNICLLYSNVSFIVFIFIKNVSINTLCLYLKYQCNYVREIFNRTGYKKYAIYCDKIRCWGIKYVYNFVFVYF